MKCNFVNSNPDQVFCSIYLTMEGALHATANALEGQKKTCGGQFSPPIGSSASNLGHHTWQQAPLTTEPSCQPSKK